jgi:GNAT superfamily N-acetyltransferase
MGQDMHVRGAVDDDWPDIWPFWHAIVAAGETYTYPPSTGYEEARSNWMLSPPAEVLVAEDDSGAVRGSAQLRPNQIGLGDHVANASFMVDPSAWGLGIGRQLGEAVLERARGAGYQAVQFNAVVATNESAIRLWESLGFQVVGRVPQAFRHPTGDLVDLLVMHRFV